jgi:hypothetical protein
MRKREPIGVLDPTFDWASLTEEERERIFYRNEPDRAYELILALRESNARYIAMLDEVQSLARQAVQGWRVLMTAKDAVDEREKALEQKLVGLQRSRQALDQKTATAENAARSNIVTKRIEDFARGRVKEQPTIKAKEIALEIEKDSASASTPWAVKNKDGDPLAFNVLLRKVGPIVKKAKNDHRRNKL